MPEPEITNLVKFYAVMLLLEKKHHGYELMKEIGKRLEKKISPGQMYPFLAGLEQNGLVRAKGGKKDLREKTVYSLTPKGHRFAKKMLERFGGLIEIAVAPHITICTHCGCKVFEGGTIETVHGKQLKFCCMHCAKSFHAQHEHARQPKQKLQTAPRQ